MASSAVLYTPEVLGLATSLARFPLNDSMALRGSARSASCGSTLTIGVALDGDGIARIGVSAQACAVGQAAAAIFAGAAPGHTASDIAAAEAAITAWLGQGDPMPNWPGLATIAAAAAYPARHGAILLAWRACLVALSSERTGR